ncbi:hypothetical protein PAECIP111893_03644 [Paenibacillus plantiphilus]|uniref:Uncharacterized protein n=1 Tax=Paenibacillus plantiphilus TaxID=2905650 RepID=A0ABM9CHB6_9BACL|nr:hypothetical protein [Paenibacillus plantiphilus]CAH1213184.1 hypothetical protein PAECIP111893_03644 [Paenibacillus plantiphilus]
MKMEQISKEKMPTATTANHYPIHRWYNFVAGYSPEYVHLKIMDYKERQGHFPIKIYDPFAGCATTNVVANTLNIPSIGVERNPIFYKIGLAKTNATDVRSYINDISAEFLESASNTVSNGNLSKLPADAKIFLLKLFPEGSLEKLLELKSVVSGYRDIKKVAGFIFLSKVIDMVTHSKTDGIYKAPTSRKQYRTVEDSIVLAETIFNEDSLLLNNHESLSEYIFDSSVDFQPEENSIDLVVFSPPYLNNFDFAEMTRMHMYFWGEAGSWREISDKHRNHMLVNTTTALKLVRSLEQQEQYRQSLPNEVLAKVEPIVSELFLLRKEKPSKKDYNLIIYPYLAQMQAVLKRCFTALRTGGAVHIVVSDAAFYGIHIDTQEYLADLMRDMGYSKVSIEQMRTRGKRWILDKRASSGKQLGEYEIFGTKE